MELTKKFVIQEAFPELQIDTLRNLKFKDEYGKYVDDLFVLNCDLSNRLKHILLSYNLKRISSVLFLECIEVRNLKKMGDLSYSALIDYIRIHVECVFDGDTSKNLIDLIKSISTYKLVDDESRYRLIDNIFPYENVHEETQLRFKINETDIVDDFNVEDDSTMLLFSVRLRNCLIQFSKGNHIKTMKEFLFLDSEKVRTMKNLGKKSFQELLDVLEKMIVLQECNQEDVSEESMNDFVEKMKMYLMDDSIDFPFNSLLNNIRIDYLSEFKNENIEIDDSLVSKILRMQQTFQMQSDYVFELIKNKTDEVRNEGISELQLLNLLPHYFKKYNLLPEVLQSLVDRNMIFKFYDKYQKKVITLAEWLETVKEKYKIIVMNRLEGQTLEEIGSTMGVTRERVRQICAKNFRECPRFYEDRFSYWFEKYDLNLEDMHTLFGLSKIGYGYLKLNYKPGTLDISLLDSDVNMGRLLYTRFKEYIKKYCVYLNEHYVPIYRATLLVEVIRNYCKEDTHIKDLYDFYYEFLEKNNLSDNQKLLFPNERSFEARVQDDKNSLWKFGRKVRFYPIENYDVCEFVSELNLDKYKDIEISTLLLFNENKELMKQYDIRDEYELHNYLKKTESEWNPDNRFNLEFTRMPLISFGNVDRKKQYSEFLKQIAPVTLEEYGQLCEMEFGISPKTSNSNHRKYIDEYYHNGIFEVDQPLLDDEEIMKLDLVLDKEFYTLEDMKKIIFSELPNVEISKLNARNYKRLGYKVYSGYLVKNTYPSATDYFNTLFLNSEVLDLNKLDTRILNFSAATSSLYDLRLNHELIEIDDKLYIRKDRFERITNCKIEEFDRFINHVLESAKDYSFFTMKKLFEDGFEDDLLNINMSRYFFTALVKNSQRIKYIKVAGDALFFQNNQDDSCTCIDFIRFIMEEKLSFDIYDLIDYIEDVYGILLQKDKLTYWISQSEMYYDSTMEKVYLNKDEYYNEFD